MTALKFDPNIFRAYDIRGIVNQTLTPDHVYWIGRAISSTMVESHLSTIAIARDGRLSGPGLSEALTEGLLASGCDVVDLGMVPTPLLYYATCLPQLQGGVMITGSHNPPDYNGLKMVIDGVTLAEDAVLGLYTRIQKANYTEGQGRYTVLDVCETYIADVVNTTRLLKPLKIVIDAGNGVTGMIAPRLFRALGCEVSELYCDVDGAFPNHDPDPSQPQNLQILRSEVKAREADVGIAFDGDGDRLGVVTNAGEIIYSDRLLMLYALDVLSQNPSNKKIIYDVKCTHHLAEIIRQHDGEPMMWKTGHALIKGKLKETQALLAGEMSGHFFFRDHWNGYDDALYAAARLLAILARSEMSCHQLFSALPNSISTPEIKLAVEEDEKFPLMQQLRAKVDFQQAKDIMMLDGIRVNFADGWGLVRASNTSPYLILRFEALNEIILENIQQCFKEWMWSVKPGWVLPF